MLVGRNTGPGNGVPALTLTPASHPIIGIVAVKVYPSVTRVVKGLATANFTTLPETVQLARKRRCQAAQLLREMQFTDYGGTVGKVRVEVTLNGPLWRAVQVACQVGRDVTPAVEWRTFTYSQYGTVRR